MALPFLNKDGVSTQLFFNAIAGDLIFTSIIFGAYALLKTKSASSKALA
jgi:hypothetical protein